MTSDDGPAADVSEVAGDGGAAVAACDGVTVSRDDTGRLQAEAGDTERRASPKRTST